MIGTAIQNALVAVIPNTFAQIVDEGVDAPYCLHTEYETPLRLKSGLAGYSYEVEVFIVDTTPELVKTKSALVVAALEALADIGGWYLPSTNELNQMILRLSLVEAYWSSSEFSATQAYTVSETMPGMITPVNTNKSSGNKVRQCRKFTAAAGAYSLGDTGPAGGKIFYVSGTTFWEAALTDLSASQAWSNITDTLIGTTSTSVNEGKNNTNEIINQAGHTASAAKLCDDYDVYGTRIENVTYEGDFPGFDPESELYGSLLRFTIETANR